MAYVAITTTLIDEVTRKLASLKQTEFVTIGDITPICDRLKADPAVHEMALLQLWGDNLDLRERLTPHNREFTIRAKLKGEGEQHIVIDINSKEVPCFSLPRDRYSYYIYIDLDMRDNEAFREALRIQTAQEECSVRWEAVQEQVKKFLKSCKSLNEGLKLWPDVARYIPKSYLDKAALKAEKKVKGENDALAALAAMDMDAINTSTVLARMAGAKV